MSKRHKDAMVCQSGACNPTPMAKALYEACMEVSREGGIPREDAAVRMIAHQLSYILKMYEIDDVPNVYSELYAVIESKSKED